MDPDDRRVLVLVLAGIAVLSAIVALAAPWWIVQETADTRQGSGSRQRTAGPFRGGSLIGDGQALVAGVLAAVGLAGLAVGTVLAAVGPAARFGVPAALAALVGVALLLAATLGAAATWHTEELGFWDSARFSFEGNTFEARSFAGPGWYAAVTAGGLGGLGGVIHLAGAVGSRPKPAG